MPGQTNVQAIESAIEKHFTRAFLKIFQKNVFALVLENIKQLLGKGGIDGRDVRMIIFRT